MKGKFFVFYVGLISFFLLNSCETGLETDELGIGEVEELSSKSFSNSKSGVGEDDHIEILLPILAEEFGEELVRNRSLRDEMELLILEHGPNLSFSTLIGEGRDFRKTFRSIVNDRGDDIPVILHECEKTPFGPGEDDPDPDPDPCEDEFPPALIDILGCMEIGFNNYVNADPSLPISTVAHPLDNSPSNVGERFHYIPGFNVVLSTTVTVDYDYVQSNDNVLIFRPVGNSVFTGTNSDCPVDQYGVEDFGAFPQQVN